MCSFHFVSDLLFITTNEVIKKTKAEEKFATEALSYDYTDSKSPRLGELSQGNLRTAVRVYKLFVHQIMNPIKKKMFHNMKPQTGEYFKTGSLIFELCYVFSLWESNIARAVKNSLFITRRMVVRYLSK